VEEWYEFSNSGRSVRRIVRVPHGGKVDTTLRLDAKGDADQDPRAAFDGAFLRRSRPPHSWTRGASTIKVADLFCGCGGLSLGAREACAAAGRQFAPVLALDNDLDSLQVYTRNLGCANTVHDDAMNVVDGELNERLTDRERAFVGKLEGIDILLAGPPCQGYSDLNNYTRRSDPRNALYERVARVAELTRPTHILIENVPMVVHGDEGTVHRAIEVLQRLGYEVDSGIVDVAEIGVPQRRKRHLVTASLCRTFSIEEVMGRHRVREPRHVMWAVGDLESEEPNGIFTQPSRLSQENVERVAYLHDNNLYDLPNYLRPKCHSDGNHSYKSMYGRLRPYECAQTITSGFGSPGQGRFVHPTQRRVITPHEAARLQFFPDFFDFSSVEKRTSLATMIGNAAPMKLSYVFCLEFLS